MNRAFAAWGRSLHLEYRSLKSISFTSKLSNLHKSFDPYLKWRQVKIHPRLSFPDLGKKCVVWNFWYSCHLNKFSRSLNFNTTSKKLAHYQLLEPCHKLGPIRPLCLLCNLTLHNQRSSCKDAAPVLANNPSSGSKGKGDSDWAVPCDVLAE